MKCLYCLEEKPNNEFSKEHIVPRQLGHFNFPTIKICKNCNNKFSREFEDSISRVSTLKGIINMQIDDDTLNNAIREFSEDYRSQRFLLKICFNFIYLLLPEKLFMDLEKSVQNSINLIRNKIFNRSTYGNEEIKIIMPTNRNKNNVLEEYYITLSNNMLDNSKNRHLEIQLDIFNLLTIKFTLNILTTDEEFSYMFIFSKEKEKVTFLNLIKEDKPKNWSSGLKSYLKKEFEKRIII